MLKQASQLQVYTDLINNVIEESDSKSCLTIVSSLTACTGNKQHTKMILKGGVDVSRMREGLL